MSKLERMKTMIFGNEEADLEINDMDIIGEEGNEVSESVQQIGVLIDRMADPRDYRFLRDIDFLIETIGMKDYPGSPAVDVLPSHDDIEKERRNLIKDYVFCLSTWAEGVELDEALGEFKADEKILRNVYTHLGTLDEDKKKLAEYLVESLRDKIFSPVDVVSQLSDEDFIIHVYKTILGREPDKDEFKLRLKGLKRGQSHQELIKEVLDSKETSKKMIAEIAASIDANIT